MRFRPTLSVVLTEHENTSAGALSGVPIASPIGIGHRGEKFGLVLERIRDDSSKASAQISSHAFQSLPIHRRWPCHLSSTFLRCELQIDSIKREKIESGTHRSIPSVSITSFFFQCTRTETLTPRCLHGVTVAHIEFFHNQLGVPNVGFVLETCCCYRDDAVEDLDLFLVADIVA